MANERGDQLEAEGVTASPKVAATTTEAAAAKAAAEPAMAAEQRAKN